MQYRIFTLMAITLALAISIAMFIRHGRPANLAGPRIYFSLNGNNSLSMEHADWKSIEDSLRQLLKMGSFGSSGDRLEVQLGRSNTETGGTYRDYVKTVTFAIEDAGSDFQPPRLALYRYFEDSESGELVCTLGKAYEAEPMLLDWVRNDFEPLIGLVATHEPKSNQTESDLQWTTAQLLTAMLAAALMTGYLTHAWHERNCEG